MERERQKEREKKKLYENPQLNLRPWPIRDKKKLSPSVGNDLSLNHFWVIPFVGRDNPTLFLCIWLFSFQRTIFRRCLLRHCDGHQEQGVVWIRLFHRLLDFLRREEGRQVPRYSLGGVTPSETGMDREEPAWAQWAYTAAWRHDGVE